MRDADAEGPDETRQGGPSENGQGQSATSGEEMPHRRLEGESQDQKDAEQRSRNPRARAEGDREE